MKIDIHVTPGLGLNPTPAISFSICPDQFAPDWLETGASVRQILTREAIQDLRDAAERGEAILDKYEAEQAIRAEIAARAVA